MGEFGPLFDLWESLVLCQRQYENSTTGTYFRKTRARTITGPEVRPSGNLIENPNPEKRRSPKSVLGSPYTWVCENRRPSFRKMNFFTDLVSKRLSLHVFVVDPTSVSRSRLTHPDATSDSKTNRLPEGPL